MRAGHKLPGEAVYQLGQRSVVPAVGGLHPGIVNAFATEINPKDTKATRLVVSQSNPVKVADKVERSWSGINASRSNITVSIENHREKCSANHLDGQTQSKLPIMPYSLPQPAFIRVNLCPSVVQSEFPPVLQNPLSFRLAALNYPPMPKAKGAESAVDEIQKLSFEDALKRLESIVESMEAQELPLETLLAHYQEGTNLAQLCQARLNAAELSVQQLEKNTKGELTLKPVPSTEEEE